MRITIPFGKAAHIARGTLIEIEVVDGGYFERVAGTPKLTLAQKLKAFDPISTAVKSLPLLASAPKGSIWVTQQIIDTTPQTPI